METFEPVSLFRHRHRRRIAMMVLLPVVAALIVWLLESGDWLVIYNDGAEPIAEICLQAGQERWTVRELGPKESRRLRVRSGEDVEVVVRVANWSPKEILRANFDWHYVSIVTLRLNSYGVVTSTSERGLWHRVLNW